MQHFAAGRAVLKTGFRSRKRKFIIFFNSQGPIVVNIMPDKATIIAAYYTTSVLIQVASKQCSPPQSSPHTDVP